MAHRGLPVCVVDVTLMLGYATTFHEVYVLRAIMGVSEALYIPAPSL